MKKYKWLVPTLYIIFLMLPIYWLINMSFKTTTEIINTYSLCISTETVRFFDTYGFKCIRSFISNKVGCKTIVNNWLMFVSGFVFHFSIRIRSRALCLSKMVIGVI